MASYPTAKVHRENRRKLGRGQSVQRLAATLTATVSTVTVSFTSDVPIVINGPIPATTTNGVYVSQIQHTPTTFDIVFSLTQAAATVAIPANCGAIATFQGGGNAAFSDTF